MRSAKLLKKELGYVPEGWGRMRYNKREALFRLKGAGIPIPTLYTADEAFFSAKYDLPVVGRRDKHAHGTGFFMCYTPEDIQRTRRFKRPPTHYLKWIYAEREFRVHVCQGKVIKLMDRPTGWYPGSGPAEPFNRKKTLRRIALEAVEALGMTHGAVDILYADEEFYVLEVNSGPALDNPTTLEKYVEAYKGESFFLKPEFVREAERHNRILRLVYTLTT